MDCIHCRKSIPERASFCTECKKYQNQLLSILILLGALSGGAAVIVGIITYVSTTLPSYWRTMHNKDVAAITLQYNSVSDRLTGVYGNAGAQAAFIRDIMFYFPTRDNAFRSFSRSVNKNAEPGAVVHAERGTSSNEEAKYSTAFAINLNDSWRLNRDWSEVVLKQTNCFSVVVQEETSFRTSVIGGQNRRYGQDLLTVPHETFIRYRPVNSTRWVVKKIPTRAVIYTNGDDAQCSEIMMDFGAVVSADEVVTP